MRSSAFRPRVAVVGAGSIGLLFAAAFGQAYPVALVTRREDVRATVALAGIAVTLPDGTKLVAPAGRIDCAPDQPGRFDFVLVACRSGDSAYALETAQRLAGPDGRILVVQNGLRAWELARSDRIPCICGATYEIAHPIAPNAVSWTRVGRTEIAASARDVDAIEPYFAAAGMNLLVAGSEAEVLWRKVVLTLPNWIAAATAMPLHAVVESEHGLSLLADLVAEIAPAARADGVELSQERALADFEALRGTGSLGSAYTALLGGQDLEVVDICRSVIERGLPVPRTEALMRLACAQTAVHAP